MNASSTSCVECETGKYHADAEVAAWEESHCSHCPHGKYQMQSGSKECFECASGRYTDLDGAKKECTNCTVVSTNPPRFYWTKDQAGANACVRHPLDCNATKVRDPTSVGSWSSCTKSCKAVGAGYGSRYRSLQPTWHAWGEEEGAVSCSSAAFEEHSGAQDNVVWAGSTPATLGDVWTETQRCNMHACPIDCVVTPWTEYSVCTGVDGMVAHCGGGKMTRTRTVTEPVQYGGKPCPAALTNTEICNPHKCEDSVCHKDFVTCSLHTVHYARKPSQERTTTCQQEASGSYQVANPTAAPCHKCDSALECSMAANTATDDPSKPAGWERRFQTIAVQHHKDFMKYQGKFHCKIVSVAPIDPFKDTPEEKNYFKNGRRVHQMHKLPEEHQKCVCTCDTHPTACYRKNYRIVNVGHIQGNKHTGIDNLDVCSNMCAKHPDCTAWEYDSTKLCVLKSDEGKDVKPIYAKNADASMTTYVGLNSGNKGCVKKRELICPMGKYKWIDAVTDTHFCEPCADGLMSTGENQIGAESCTHNAATLQPAFSSAA